MLNIKKRKKKCPICKKRKCDHTVAEKKAKRVVDAQARADAEAEAVEAAERIAEGMNIIDRSEGEITAYRFENLDQSCYLDVRISNREEAELTMFVYKGGRGGGRGKALALNVLQWIKVKYPDVWKINLQAVPVERGYQNDPKSLLKYYKSLGFIHQYPDAIKGDPQYTILFQNIDNLLRIPLPARQRLGGGSSGGSSGGGGSVMYARDSRARDRFAGDDFVSELERHQLDEALFSSKESIIELEAQLKTRRGT